MIAALKKNPIALSSRKMEPIWRIDKLTVPIDSGCPN